VALRIKSRWHDDDAERSLDEIAGALAFISWRIAKDKAINLHGQDYVYESDEQRFAVITEYLVFQLQIIDRLAASRLELDDADRRKLVITVAKHLAGHLHDNSVDIFGPGDYLNPFIAKINQRGEEYAELSYTDEGPSYPFMRHLGYEIQQIMGETQENRWVIDQVMDKDGVEIDREIRRAVDNLFE
jgi:stalled ribosome rescue protein Dom34